MNQQEPDNTEPGDLPAGLSNPSLRAMAQVGITRLDHLSQISEKDLLALHGVGPKTIRILALVMAERGISFAPDTPKGTKSN